jgi:diguanylate cyclase (GGDEF)-like protein
MGQFPHNYDVRFLLTRPSVLHGAVLIIAVVTTFWTLSYRQTSIVEKTALQNAELYSEALKEFRTLYTTKVVQPMQAIGVEIIHDYENNPNAIPLPATLSMELGKQIGASFSGANSRLYSPYPFPWRVQSGGLRDDFNREAWEYLKEYPEKPYYRYEEVDGRMSLRYATADLMGTSCVSCHNSHTDTPKNDWQVGDVRGVLEVVHPMDTILAENRSSIAKTMAWLIFFFFATVTFFWFTFRKLSHSKSELMKTNDRLKIAMNDLTISATTDPLTGLPNRTVFLEQLKRTMKQSMRDGNRFAVVFLDFDRFKFINDSLGHDVGDALLCSIADVFRRETRESDIVARFGGDEFIVLLDGMSEWSDAIGIIERLLKSLGDPHKIENNQIVMKASAGIVTNEHPYKNAIDMIRDADVAMYQAKANGKDRIVCFDVVMHDRMLNRMLLETTLHKALEEDQLRLVYQPIIDLTTSEVSGFEALIRWDHPELGEVSPNDFIPIAEETGLIIEIGYWVLRTACKQIADWNLRLGMKTTLSMNVNISKRQLLNSSLFDDVLECLREFDMSPEQLTLEVTESIISDEGSQIIPLLDQLRDHGVRIALDDFGTGTSSLSALHSYPIDMLKIDQAFIRDLVNDRSLLAVVASITMLAESLGFTTVAEGIETPEAIIDLQSLGCTWGQGYYFAKPMSPVDAEAYLLGMHLKKRVA